MHGYWESSCCLVLKYGYHRLKALRLWQFWVSYTFYCMECMGSGLADRLDQALQIGSAGCRSPSGSRWSSSFADLAIGCFSKLSLLEQQPRKLKKWSLSLALSSLAWRSQENESRIPVTLVHLQTLGSTDLWWMDSSDPPPHQNNRISSLCTTLQDPHPLLRRTWATKLQIMQLCHNKLSWLSLSGFPPAPCNCVVCATACIDINWCIDSSCGVNITVYLSIFGGGFRQSKKRECLTITYVH